MPSSYPSSPDAAPTQTVSAAAPPASHPDPHTRITAAILGQLDTADPASWTPPWHGADPLPRNALTGQRYQGLNVLVLWAAAQANGYAEARWASYRQWAALGAQVRRGERGTAILFYRDVAPADGADRTADGAEDAPRFVARASTVFNAAQVDGAPDPAANLPGGPVPEAEPTLTAFVTATGAVIVEGGTRACYVPSTDTIHLPTRASFRTPEGYAATLIHELVHWTGAPHRLHRDLAGRLSTHAYAAEELVAELGAAFVLADLGVARTPHPDHAAYLAHWLALLRAEPRALSIAASHASRAAAYLVGLQPGAESDERTTPLPVGSSGTDAAADDTGDTQAAA